MPNYKNGSEIKRPGIINRERRLDYSDDKGELLSTASPEVITAANKGWGKGELEVTEEGAFFTPPPGGTPVGPGEDTVEGRITGLLKKGSLYRTAAEADALSKAKQRGLQNTTMAITGGTRAAIESALPIAQQDAGYEQERKLAAQAGRIQTGLYRTQGDISSELSAQGYKQEGGLLTQGAAHEKALAAQRFEQETAMQTADVAWKSLDLQARMDVEFKRLDEDNKSRFNETYNAISEDYNQDYMAILANPDWATPEDRQEAIRILNANTQNRFSTAASVAQVELNWSPSSAGASQKLGKVGEAARELDLTGKIKKAITGRDIEVSTP